MADDDNLPLPATEIVEQLISSFINSTSPSRERAISVLHTHQWDLSAAVSAFTGNNVADAAAAKSNVFNPSDEQLHGTLDARTRISNLRIDIPVSPHSPSGYIPPESSPSRLRLPSASNPSDARNPFSSGRAAADKPCESQTIERRQSAGNIRPPADISGGNDNEEEQSGTIVQDPKKDEDGDDTDEESDVETPVEQSSRPGEVWTTTQIVTIWRNGYTVNDSPLFTLDNPANAEFLERVQSLHSPRDLNPMDMQIRYRVKLIRRQEEYFNVHQAFGRRRLIIPFQGVGRTLSGPPDSASTEPPASSESMATTQRPLLMNRVVDPAAPTTLIQLRLADGCVIFRFNTHQTVRDVINAGLIGDSRDYQLLIMGSPPKPLLDFDQTIEKAGISNSVLILRF
ncbi:unnamed protein product [Thlaspi arvense]|uniref:SEP domain-containing protein n=1 Tax=Thlaspi arvense TaxID=13288 RepID=A0AAU9RYP6_THLAR|nr:unnamed protein product [Thlaspi arvense]